MPIATIDGLTRSMVLSRSASAGLESSAETSTAAAKRVSDPDASASMFTTLSYFVTAAAGARIGEGPAMRESNECRSFVYSRRTRRTYSRVSGYGGTPP